MLQRQTKKQTDAQSDWVVFGGAKTTPTIWNAVGCRARVRQGNADFQYKKNWEGNLNFHASNDDNASDALGAFSNAFDLKLHWEHISLIYLKYMSDILICILLG